MNIFWLDEDLTKRARMHNDKHCVKMIVEIAQLLSTAHHVLDGLESSIKEKLYRVTHQNHPCAVWVRESDNNYAHTWCLLLLLCAEYTHRYGKIHKVRRELLDVLTFPPNNIPIGGITTKPACMPDECKIYVDDTIDVVASYRNYYYTKKQHIAAWKNRDVPEWYIGELK